MQSPIVVYISRAYDEVLNSRHQGMPAESLPVMEIDADESCRPALHVHVSATPMQTCHMLLSAVMPDILGCEYDGKECRPPVSSCSSIGLQCISCT